RLFIPRHLYYRFRDIHHSDEDLRSFIDSHRDELPTTFPVEVAFNLRATRPGVLDVGKVDTLRPGMHVYPNQVILPQDRRAYARVLNRLQNFFGVPDGTPQDIATRATGQAIEIDVDEAAALVRLIRTRS